MKNREVFYIVEYIIIIVLFVILGSFDEKSKGFAIIIVLLLSIFLIYNKFSIIEICRMAPILLNLEILIKSLT